MSTHRMIVVLLFAASATAGEVRAQDYMGEHEPARLALVVGNPNYTNLAQLKSAKLDAEQMAARLTKLGFTVTLVPELTRVRDFEDAVMPAFRKNIERGDIVVFYFSGHGFAYGPHNYIAPADLPRVVTDKTVAQHAIAVEGLEDYFGRESPGLILMLIDACRSIGDFVITDSTNQNVVEKGTAKHVQLNQDINTVEGYAARAGSAALASNADGTLSPFTKSLVAHIDMKGAEFTSMFKDVTADVRIATRQKQNPGIVNWSASDVYLNPTDEIRAQEKEAWLAALSDSSWDDVQRYSYRHALSRYAAAARQWLDHNPHRERGTEFEGLSSAETIEFWQGGGMSTPLRVTEAKPAASGLRDLVDAIAISNAVTTIESGGDVIAWARISVAVTKDRDEADARSARLTHVRYLLKRAGVDGRWITAAAAPPTYSGSGVRIEFFGRKRVPGTR